MKVSNCLLLLGSACFFQKLVWSFGTSNTCGLPWGIYVGEGMQLAIGLCMALYGFVLFFFGHLVYIVDTVDMFWRSVLQPFYADHMLTTCSTCNLWNSSAGDDLFKSQGTEPSFPNPSSLQIDEVKWCKINEDSCWFRTRKYWEIWIISLSGSAKHHRMDYLISKHAEFTPSARAAPGPVVTRFSSSRSRYTSRNTSGVCWVSSIKTGDSTSKCRFNVS